MNGLETAIYQRLTGGTALTALLSGTASVYNQVVPPGVGYPVVVFGLMGGGDANDHGKRRKELLYQVKGISKTSLQTAGAIDAEADELLHGQSLTISGWTNCWLMRSRDLSFVEVTPEGRSLYHSGGVYQIWLSEQI